MTNLIKNIKRLLPVIMAAALPVAFVIDSEGVIRERVIDPAKLNAAVAKAL